MRTLHMVLNHNFDILPSILSRLISSPLLSFLHFKIFPLSLSSIFPLHRYPPFPFHPFSHPTFHFHYFLPSISVLQFPVLPSLIFFYPIPSFPFSPSRLSLNIFISVLMRSNEGTSDRRLFH